MKYVLPSALHSSIPAIPEIQSFHVSIAYARVPSKALHTSRFSNLEAYAPL
jgi:hypothetical protein